MDFIRVAYKENKDGTREFHPSLQALESQDLVIRGGQFVAIWDEDAKLYSRRQSHMPDIIDRAFLKMLDGQVREGDSVKKVRNFDNQIYNRLMSLIRSIGDMGPELDQRLVFADEIPTKEHAATFKMSYSLSDAPCAVWDELCDTLYDPAERLKFEWAIGSILSGEAATKIQKFYVFFGPPGSGKSTIMDIIETVFAGHTASFSAYNMGKSDSQFSLEPFKNNPLVAIDQDGDLSRIELNTNLNQIVSHDKLHINSKGKNLYEITPRSTLFVGSNKPVKITDRKSGLFRRVVDIQPSGRTIPEVKYHKMMAQVKFEVGSIAKKCLQIFEEYGPEYLSSYRSTDMMYRTNDIFNFIEDHRLILSKGCSLKQAHKLYSEWCEETDTRNIYKQYQFRDLLMDYFKEFHQEIMIDGIRHRSWFLHLRELETFSWKGSSPKPPQDWLELEKTVSLLDDDLEEMPAQLASMTGRPTRAWNLVTNTLYDIETSLEHYVKVPKRRIVIDFDLTDDQGVKSLERNLAAASKWPPTYAEVSRSGAGLHLHYDHDGDVELLANVDPGGLYEVKTLLGNSSLRRKLSLCNQLPVATISSGLPLKEVKVLDPETVHTEKGLRTSLLKGLRKEVHSGTKSNMDFIEMILTKAYDSGLTYDISDMWDDILSFAMGSSNQRAVCLDIAMRLKLKSDADIEAAVDTTERPIAYFDCEVFPNLFSIGYRLDGPDAKVVKMLNPSASQVQELIDNFRLIGFFNRTYDNHIIYAASLGWDVSALYQLSRQIIVENDRGALFAAAYNLSYGDAYDIIVEKHSLKWWMIKLGIPHVEMDLPWDQDVPEERVLDVLEYMANDVDALYALVKHREADFRAREILAQLSGLAVCNTNRQHTEKLVFPDLGKYDPAPLEYTDLTERFPGYTFDRFAPGKEKSLYKDFKVGEGGWVHAKPGMYYDVAVLDVASMHPTSIVEMNCFGPYTKNFQDLLNIRLAIKKGDLETASLLYDGRVAPYLGDKATAKGLSDALKIVINSVYGLTAASFPNKFKDDRNADNIVAKRGALFMVDLKEFVEQAGFEVVHIKTDSIKIPNATPKIIAQVSEFGEQYGYTFEHEDTYDRFCLVNDSTYVALSRKTGHWEATGAQFLHPVVFKTLFTKEDLLPDDYVEVKQVSKGAMYLIKEDTGIRQFVGKFGAFVPVMGGRLLLRIDGEKEHAVNGTKDFRWEIDSYAQDMEVDFAYFQKLIDAGRDKIATFGDYATFTRP